MTSPAEPTTPESPDSPDVLARIAEGMPLVEILARQMRRLFGDCVPLEDLVSYGHEALLVAARTFDPDRAVPFRKWANLRIRGSLVDGMRQHGNLPKRVYRKLRAIQAAARIQEAALEEMAGAPIASPEAADEAVGDQLAASAMAMAMAFLRPASSEALERKEDPGGGPEDEVTRADLIAKIHLFLAERPEQERHIIQRHYFEDVSVEEAAKELGLSKSWGSRLHARAIDSLVRSIRRGAPPD